MKKLKFLKEHTTPSGQRYLVGVVHRVSDKLAEEFIRSGVAYDAATGPPKKQVQRKAASAPELNTAAVEPKAETRKAKAKNV